MPQDLQTAFSPEIWSKLTLARLDQINVGLACGAVNRDYEGEIKQAGDTVHVRTYGNVAVGPYTRGAPINYTNLTPSKQPLTINDSQYWAIQVDDLDEVQNDLPALKGYTGRAAVAVNEVIDTKVFSYYGSAISANQIGSGGVITISASNAYTYLVDAGAKLDAQHVPQQGRWAVVGPNYKAFLNKDTTYLIRATEMGDSIVRMGLQGIARKASSLPNFIGQVAGFNVFMSNNLPSDSGGSYAQYGGPGVISYAGQLRKIEQVRRESTFASAVRGLLLHDGTVFDEHAKAYGTIYTTVA